MSGGSWIPTLASLPLGGSDGSSTMVSKADSTSSCLFKSFMCVPSARIGLVDLST